MTFKKSEPPQEFPRVIFSGFFLEHRWLYKQNFGSEDLLPKLVIHEITSFFPIHSLKSVYYNPGFGYKWPAPSNRHMGSCRHFP